MKNPATNRAQRTKNIYYSVFSRKNIDKCPNISSSQYFLLRIFHLKWIWINLNRYRKIGKIQSMMNQVDGAFLFIWHTSSMACHSLPASMVNQFLSGCFMLSERRKRYFSFLWFFYDFLWFLWHLVFCEYFLYIFYFENKLPCANRPINIIIARKILNEWHVLYHIWFYESSVCGIYWIVLELWAEQFKGSVLHFANVKA